MIGLHFFNVLHVQTVNKSDTPMFQGVGYMGLNVCWAQTHREAWHYLEQEVKL